MAMQRVNPKPRWECNTAHWTREMVEDLENFSEKWMNFPGSYFNVSIYQIRSLKEGGHAWALQVMDELPEAALEELLKGDAGLWIDLEYPEEDE